MDREDQGIAAGIVVEDHLGRRVGEDAAVPIKFAVDAHCRKGRRQGAGGEDVLDANGHVAAIEIAHAASADMGGTDGQARLAMVDELEIDEVEQRLRKRRSRIIAGAVGAQYRMGAQEGEGIGQEESWKAIQERVPVGERLSQLRPGSTLVPRRLMRHAPPEFL
jgi:hypothetical protein